MDRLNANEWLGPNGSIASPNGYTLVYQGDGNLVEYDGNGNAGWASGTDGSSPGQAIMQGDGNFVIYDASGTVVWSTDTEGNPGAQVIMQGDGNVVVYAADGTPLWASQDQNSGGFWSSVGSAFGAVGKAIGDAASAVVKTVETVANAAVDTVEGILSPVLNVAGFIIGVIEAIPIIGRLIGAIINYVTDLIWLVLSLPEIILVLIGWMPEKRLRIMVLVQQTREGPIADLNRVRQYIQRMIGVYYNECNVRVLPALPFHYASAFQDTPQVSDDYFSVLSVNATASTLTASCGFAGFTDDIGISSGNGPQFQLLMNASSGFWGAFRRVSGYGAPITTFAVQSFTGNNDGCSEYVGTDYVLVAFKPPQEGVPEEGRTLTMAHENGHACGLWHTDQTVMESGPTTRAPTFNKLQKIVIRTSRHVTYL